MLQILSITAPIYLIIAAGWLSVRSGLFKAIEMRVVGRYVTSFCLPALLFKSLSQSPLDEVFNGPYLIAYAVGSLGVLVGVTLFMRRVRGKSLALSALQGLGMSSSNSAFVGYPIATQLVGQAAGVGLALTMLVENLLAIPLAVSIADRGSDAHLSWRDSFLQTLKGLAKNPMIVAILAGFAHALMDWKLPEVVTRTVGIVASGASPASLFAMGGSLVGLRLEGQRGDVAAVSLGKLFLHPLAVLAVLMVLPPIDPALRTAAIIYASVPMLSIYPVLAMKHHHEGFCAATLLLTTVLSFITITVWLWAAHSLLHWL